MTVPNHADKTPQSPSPHPGTGVGIMPQKRVQAAEEWVEQSFHGHVPFAKLHGQPRHKHLQVPTFVFVRYPRVPRLSPAPGGTLQEQTGRMVRLLRRAPSVANVPSQLSCWHPS